MTPGKRPLVRRIKRVVSHVIGDNPVGNVVRRSVVGKVAREVKARVRGITLSRREFATLLSEIKVKVATDDIIERIRRMTAGQRKELLDNVSSRNRTYSE